MNALKLIRIEKGLSQYELALASGVPRYVIQLAETATRLPNVTQQAALADALGVKIEDLLPRNPSISGDTK